jgi:hypothetical protein
MHIGTLRNASCKIQVAAFCATIFSVIFMVLKKIWLLISLYSINRLVFITEKNRVYCAVRTVPEARFRLIFFFITVYHHEQPTKNFIVIYLSNRSVVVLQ